MPSTEAHTDVLMKHPNPILHAQRCVKELKEKVRKANSALSKDELTVEDRDAWKEQCDEAEAFADSLRLPTDHKEVTTQNLLNLGFIKGAIQAKPHVRSVYPAYTVSCAPSARQQSDLTKSVEAYESLELERKGGLYKKSFQIHTDGHVETTFDALLAATPELQTFLEKNLGGVDAIDTDTLLVPVVKTDVPATSNKKTRSVKIPQTTAVEHPYDPLTRLLRAFPHFFRGTATGDKTVNFRGKDAELSFLFTWQVLTGLKELPAKGSDEAKRLADELQGAVVAICQKEVSPQTCPKGLPVEKGEFDAKKLHESNTTTAQSQPQYQLFYSIRFPDGTKLAHGLGDPLDGRFYQPVSKKIFAFLIDAVTRLVGKEALSPMIVAAAAALEQKPRSRPAEFKFEAIKLATDYSMNNWPRDGPLKPLAKKWNKQPFAAPCALIDETLVALSANDVEDSRVIESMLLASGTLDGEEATVAAFKDGLDVCMSFLQTLAYRCTGREPTTSVANSMSLVLHDGGSRKRTAGEAGLAPARGGKRLIVELQAQLAEAHNTVRTKDDRIVKLEGALAAEKKRMDGFMTTKAFKEWTTTFEAHMKTNGAAVASAVTNATLDADESEEEESEDEEEGEEESGEEDDESEGEEDE